jgi:hypothetical protein
MWYTKQLMFCPYPSSSLIEMLYSSYPPSSTLFMDLASGIGSLTAVRMPVEPLPEFETFDFSKGIPGVVVVNSQIDVYVSYLS